MQYFIDFFKGLLTPLIALIALYIAFQQWRNNRDKLRFNLLDNRFKVYQALTNLFICIIREADVSNEALLDYRKHINEGYFLFDEKISAYLDEVFDKAIKLQFYKARLEKLPIGDERTEVVAKERDILKWIDKEFRESKIKFEKYLRFK